jgi:hypothetical protein
MSEEGCNSRPRFKAQVKNGFDVHIPVPLVDELKIVPGDYLTVELVPTTEGHDKPFTTSHEIEAKQRMAEADEIGTATFNYYLPIWIKNFREHLALTKGRDIKTVKDLPKLESPMRAIVVGAGPSLYTTTDEQWDALRDFEGVIIATNKALITIFQHDIRPDWVVVLDAEPVVFASFDDDILKQYQGRVNFMGPTVLNPKVTKFALDWAKECYWGNPHMPSGQDSEHWNINLVLELMNDIPTFDHGGNVGTCAWLLAKSMGCDPIAMLGFDLCAYPIDYEYFFNPEVGETLALNGPFRAYVSILMGATDQGWNGEPPTRTVNLTPRGVLHMSGFFPNFSVKEFTTMSRIDIIARAENERTENLRRMAERVSEAKEAMKPIFRDEV